MSNPNDVHEAAHHVTNALVNGSLYGLAEGVASTAVHVAEAATSGGVSEAIEAVGTFVADVLGGLFGN